MNAPAGFAPYTRPTPQLRRIRLARGLTQTELARLAGLSSGTVKRLEAGANDPSWSVARRLAITLGCAAADLFPFQYDERSAGPPSVVTSSAMRGQHGES